MRALILIVALGLASLGSSACVEPDLGDEPLLCNAGTPRCPKGYECASEPDGTERCVREGIARSATTGRVDGGVAQSDGR